MSKPSKEAVEAAQHISIRYGETIHRANDMAAIIQSAIDKALKREREAFTQICTLISHAFLLNTELTIFARTGVDDGNLRQTGRRLIATLEDMQTIASAHEAPREETR